MLLPNPPIRSLARAGAAILSPSKPVLVQLVVTRRCNLACGYCNEFDHVSPPVDTRDLIERIDQIADAGTVVLTLTGGEPLLHPMLDELIRHAVSRGMVCTSITNGYTLTSRWIERLNDSGLTILQVSIDNLEPNEVSEKSWSSLKESLALLRDHAKFKVTVNAVLGSSNLEETREVVQGVQEMGFYMTVGLMHDQEGQLDPGLLGDSLADFYQEIHGRSRKSLLHHVGEGWESKIIRDGSAPWKCRAGARYLYVDEEGIVSYCSQRRNDPGIPLSEYTKDHRLREFYTRKGCEDRCTISCVRRASATDSFRRQESE
jgi:MoaA/NifB/PqqE/SkfB family radical SAM enzyme